MGNGSTSVWNEMKMRIKPHLMWIYKLIRFRRVKVDGVHILSCPGAGSFEAVIRPDSDASWWCGGGSVEHHLHPSSSLLSSLSSLSQDQIGFTSSCGSGMVVLVWFSCFLKLVTRGSSSFLFICKWITAAYTHGGNPCSLLRLLITVCIDTDIAIAIYGFGDHFMFISIEKGA